MVRLAIVCCVLFCVSAPLFAENTVDILDLNTGKPINPPRPSGPDSNVAEKKSGAPAPLPAAVVDEPGFKASVKFSQRPAPKYDLGTTNTNQIPTPKNKSWSVPLEDGSSGPP